jgi:hypothetical protein
MNGRVVALAGLCAAMLGLTVAGTGTAVAALPELGRCVKVEGLQSGKKVKYSGHYKNKNCTSASLANTGKYEFLAGPGTNNKFYGTAAEPEPVFETTTGSKLRCGLIVFKGEYTGAKTEKVTISLGGCETTAANGAHQVCQTDPAKEGEIESTESFEGELGTIQSGAKPIAGWDLKHGGALFIYDCGTPPEVPSVQTIEGSVIGALSRGFFGTDLNRMSLYSVIKYKATKGLQAPESFEGQAKDVLSTKTISGLTTTTAQTGLTTTEETTSGAGEVEEGTAGQEPLEVKTK